LKHLTFDDKPILSILGKSVAGGAELRIDYKQYRQAII
jgi:hypothetical protein